MSQLSKLLDDIKIPQDPNELTFSYLEQIFSFKGIYALIAIICVPFLIPIPLWGLSTVFGIVIAALSLRLVFLVEGRLPKRLGEKTIRPDLFLALIEKSKLLSSYLEKLMKPRLSVFCTPTFVRIAGILNIWCSMLLAIPVPPVVPFTNTFPGLSMILLMLGLLEDDGFFVLLGTIGAVATTVYFILVGGVIYAALNALFEKVMQYLT